MKKRCLWAAVAGTAFTVIAALLWLACPKPELQQYQSWSRAWYDSSGKLLRIELADDDRYRLYQPIENISPLLIETTLLYEDRHYYDHWGIDVPAIFRAFWQTYISGDRRIGASTITMQVARLRWHIDSSTLGGKFVQILRAIQLARHYSKDEILEAYLNLAPYGRNIEGIGAASLIYFDKKAADLSFPEALTLSVIPQNPNKRNPASETGFKNLGVARHNLFERWLEIKPEYQSRRAVIEMPLRVRRLEDLPFYAPHFIDHLAHHHPARREHEINTSLQLTRQLTLEKVLQKYVETNKHKGIYNAALALLNYQTMEVEAMVGSADFHDPAIAGQVNGTTAKRSPGSTLKPFVYALAFDQGLVHPMSMMRDAPLRYAAFTPENFDKKFLGPLLAKEALALSRNVPAVELQARLGDSSLYELMQTAGVSPLRDKNHYGLALTLGGAEVTMLELVKLYASLANRGKLQELAFVSGAQKNKEAAQLFSEEAAFMTLDILRGIEAPSNSDYARQKLQYDVAWKTGTSWAFRDAWAVGVSGPWVMAVWVGNFDGQGNKAFVGHTAAGPLLFNAFTAIQQDSNWKLEKKINPDNMNLEKIDMCRATGDLPGKYCPRTAGTWFIPGVSPIKVSSVYRRLPIDKNTGLRLCNLDSKNLEYKVFEFWPSDLMRIFRQAGISLNTPPSYDASCSLDERNTLGGAPRIVSPQPALNYVIPITNVNSAEMEVPFSAVVDSDVEELFWFVDREYIGKVKAGETLFWPGSPGEYIVKAVDNIGRAAEARIKVLTTN